jgi:hypothetical protein
MRTPGQAIAENAGQGILRLRNHSSSRSGRYAPGRQIQNQITITTIKIKGKRTRVSAPHELVKRKRAGFHHMTTLKFRGRRELAGLFTSRANASLLKTIPDMDKTPDMDK